MTQRPLAPLRPVDHVRGPADAPLTIVQYGDYDCPHTRASNVVLRELEAELDTPLRFVFRHFPLRDLHPNAEIFSQMADAAGELGHFWDIHERLMSLDRGPTPADVLDEFERSPVDPAALRALLGTPGIVARVEEDVRSGSEAGVHSTPTWFFDGAIWQGHYDRKTLRRRVDLALSRQSPPT